MLYVKYFDVLEKKCNFAPFYYSTTNKKVMIQVKSKSVVGYALLDAVLIAAACLIPAASHMFALPLYQFNPMLAILLVGILAGRDWRNGILLAVLLPLVSCLVAGMPTAPKMVCMMAELATVASLFAWLQRRWAVLPAVLVSVLAAKVVYYVMKAIVIAPAVLVGTDWKVQLLAVLAWCGLFALVYGKKQN